MNFKTITSYILVTLTILILFTCMKILMTSKNEFLLAEDHLAKNELSKAVNHYERALRWFLPFSRTPNRAAEKLWEIAQNQQTQNQNIEALKTYRILRSAFYSVRSIYTPGKKWIHLCNEKIAHLMAFIESQERPGITFSEKKIRIHGFNGDRPPSLHLSIYNKCDWVFWMGFKHSVVHLQSSLPARPS